MQIDFKDRFSEKSENYDRYRPQYPDELFSYLASISKNHQTAWDCATGTGQSALSLSKYYSKIIATDASKSQIENATKNDKVEYRVAPAEHTNIEINSIDLITVAQALHWFDIKLFTKEVERVLKEQGVLCVWTYNLLQVKEDIDEVVNHLYQTVLDDYWPKERKLVEEGYKSIHFPFKELHTPSFHMSTEWNLSHLLGYLNTWSAVKKYQRRNGINPVDNIHDKLLALWGDPEKVIPVIWPLNVKVWIKSIRE